MSEWRACKGIGGCRMTIRYNSRRPNDVVLRERMKTIARERRRFGYRRLLALQNKKLIDSSIFSRRLSPPR